MDLAVKRPDGAGCIDTDIVARDRDVDRAVPGQHGMLIRQALLIAAAALLPMRPWAVGAAVVLPLHATSEAETLGWALSADTRLLGAGPYGGSLRVYGSRPSLLILGLMPGALVVGAGAPICGPQGTGL